MKKQVLYTQLILVAIMATFGIGCAKKASAPEAPVFMAPIPTGNGTTTTDTSSNTTYAGPFSGQPGASVNFSYDNLAVLNTYVATHPVNNPQNMAINVDLRDIGNGRYAGTIKLSYYDNGHWYTGVFESGFGVNQVSYQNIDTGKPEAEFNQWFMYQSQRVFHGFFQDSYGAVILVIDNGLDLGDGGGITEVSGSVWFKNFTPGYAQQSPEKCWFIRIGPFDCRTFLDGSGNHIITNSYLYPQNGYTRLGTFNGLNKPKAFNE